MATYAMLTRLTPETVKSPSDFQRLDQTETWTALPWERFKQLIAA